MVLSRIKLPMLAALAFVPSALAQGLNPAVQPQLPSQIIQLSPHALYEGWRARQLIGQAVMRKGGTEIGTVRDLISDTDGRLSALIVEGGGVSGASDAIYRIPWRAVDLTPGRDGITIDLSDSSKTSQYSLFPGIEAVATLPREFRLTEVIGDYARLQTGYGYGSVTDAVFDKDGRLIAVLISRDVASGGGTFAFPYPGTAGRWDPGASYYGLPFVTEAQAEAAGIRIDPKQFKDAVF